MSEIYFCILHALCKYVSRFCGIASRTNTSCLWTIRKVSVWHKLNVCPWCLIKPIITITRSILLWKHGKRQVLTLIFVAYYIYCIIHDCLWKIYILLYRNQLIYFIHFLHYFHINDFPNIVFTESTPITRPTWNDISYMIYSTIANVFRSAYVYV